MSAFLLSLSPSLPVKLLSFAKLAWESGAYTNFILISCKSTKEVIMEWLKQWWLAISYIFILCNDCIIAIWMKARNNLITTSLSSRKWFYSYEKETSDFILFYSKSMLHHVRSQKLSFFRDTYLVRWKDIYKMGKTRDKCIYKQNIPFLLQVHRHCTCYLLNAHTLSPPYIFLLCDDEIISVSHAGKCKVKLNAEFKTGPHLPHTFWFSKNKRWFDMIRSDVMWWDAKAKCMEFSPPEQGSPTQSLISHHIAHTLHCIWLLLPLLSFLFSVIQ